MGADLLVRRAQAHRGGVLGAGSDLRTPSLGLGAVGRAGRARAHQAGYLSGGLPRDDR